MYCHHFATSDAKAFRISDCEIPNWCNRRGTQQRHTR
jgi:hypothetical protein